nr:MAG TPA: hypothetical protein [Caudoviricetes sp.]
MFVFESLIVFRSFILIIFQLKNSQQFDKSQMQV